MKNYILLLFALIAIKAFGQNDQSKTDWGNLKKYAAENKSLKPPSKKEKRVVFMGDSITEFWKYTDSSFFADNPYIGRGISGQTTPQMLVRFRPDVIALKPSVVVILAGINDIAENTGPITLETVFGNIVSMAQLARSNQIRIVLCSVLPANDFPWRQGLSPADKVIRLNTMIRSWCGENNVVDADYFSAMVDNKKGLDKRYGDDGVHPNLAGYQIMEPLVQDAIKLALKKNK